MNKSIMLHTNLIICFVIIIGFVGMGLSGHATYSKVIKDDIENISKLTSSNIYADINGELTKPIYVSLTMANDSFLKNWLREENVEEDLEHIDYLQDYLLQMQQKYNYNSVFLVSSKSNKYYHYGGTHKEISRDNEHDIWYYNFLSSNLLYDLDVDSDEADNDVLTVFINCRILDDYGSLMGVVGVGVKMNHLQEMLSDYENNFHLKAFLVDPNGIVQVHTDKTLIETADMSQLYPDVPFRNDDILWFKNSNQENCLINRYIEQLNWHLIVEKDTLVLKKSLYSLIGKDFVIILVILAVLLFLSNYVLISSKKKMMSLVLTDELTGLKNRRSINELLQKELDQSKQHSREIIVFLFDIDHFKSINDIGGHLFGDSIIKRIGQVAEEVIGCKGVIARWGGDEFLGMLYLGQNEANEIINKLLHEIQKIPFQDYNISVSIGATAMQAYDDLDSIMARADCGLYESKEKGRNRVTYL